MENEAFPNEEELDVASALLLLSTTLSPVLTKMKSISEDSQIAALSYTTSISDFKSKSTDSSTVTADDDHHHNNSPSPNRVKIISETSQIAALSYTTSSVSDSKSKSIESSTVTAADDDEENDDDYDYDDASFAEAKANARRLKMIRMIRVINKLKAVRRRRSKSSCISSNKAKTATSLTTYSTSASSCVSIDSAAAASNISSSRGSSSEVNRESSVQRKMKVIFSAHMRRRAEAILKVLSCHGCASEVRIRQLLGDSPDTSKALRILLRLEEVKRTGAGGRTDPYVYAIS